VAAQQGHADAVAELLARGADVDAARTDNGVTPLIAAVQCGHTEVVAALLAGGADVEKSRFIGWSPLFVAACCGRLEVARLLLSYGADKGAPSALPFSGVEAGTTPQAVAEKMGHAHVAMHLEIA